MCTDSLANTFYLVINCFAKHDLNQYNHQFKKQDQKKEY